MSCALNLTSQPPTLEESQAYSFMNEFAELTETENTETIRKQGCDLFNRWTTWMADNQENDPNGYNASASTIFSLIIDLQLESQESAKLYERAFEVVKAGEDTDLQEFLNQRKAEYLKL